MHIFALFVFKRQLDACDLSIASRFESVLFCTGAPYGSFWNSARSQVLDYDASWPTCTLCKSYARTVIFHFSSILIITLCNLNICMYLYYAYSVVQCSRAFFADFGPRATKNIRQRFPHTEDCAERYMYCKPTIGSKPLKSQLNCLFIFGFQELHFTSSCFSAPW